MQQAKDTKKRDALRLLTSAFKQIEVDERKELNEATFLTILRGDFHGARIKVVSSKEVSTK